MKKYNTLQMAAILAKHAKDEVPWVASAPEVLATPEVDGWAPMRARANLAESNVKITDPSGRGFYAIPMRDDWMIHKDGKLPEVPGPKLLGEFVRDSGGWAGLMAIQEALEEFPEGHYKVYVEKG